MSGKQARDQWYDDVTPEKYKWFVLELIGDNNGVSWAFGIAETLFPDLDKAAAHTLASDTLLALLDEGLIFYYRSKWDDAYTNLDEHRKRAISRAELVTWFESQDEDQMAVEPDERVFLWGCVTDEGTAALRGRPQPDGYPPGL